ncbi:uncharacterized protein BO80DRAFT_287478 [Aspergillus ibericus CBS 121593]|uniref:NTF2-like protein n=1 Tax=Aspergillus ibericus CBS 121593 TaxID=1448316 RepID=A0A395H7P6_9EURO|nr:hypothetical protein BO80DRAFT_287478 [Aspergillus ibericus CBS 121593]RAL03579.1 hypothetical protein BO80DRAFT_287478 [Aspergillus ibericus CBS 121593]
MSLKDVYRRFLADPRSAPLASDVSLIYITTTTKLDGASAVVSHFTKQQRNIKTKSEIVLDAIESANSICLDIESTYEFVSGNGGAYLPSLDDNFLAGHVATFPTVHIVRFNSQNEIQNVRIYWDQASLLKQVDVIGSRGRGWPVREPKDQIRLIKNSIASGPADDGPAPTSSLPADTEKDGNEPNKQASPGKKHIKDPHAADSLFELLSPGKDRSDPVRPPRAPASAKPPPREYSELFGDHGDVDIDPPGTPSRSRNTAKAGVGKNHQASRIFDTDEAGAEGGHEQIAYRAHPKRFDHFELGADNSQREVHEKPGRPVSRQAPHWDFDDFVTPEKPKRPLRGEEIRHFGWSDDEPDLTSPPVRPRGGQARPDAETHFQLADAPEEDQNGPRIISSYQNKGMGLYKNHLFNDKEGDENAPLSVVNNGPNRKKEFETHFSLTDESPQKGAASRENQKPVPGDRQRALKNMESSWDNYDQSPRPPVKMTPPQRRSVRYVNQRNWEMGDN